MKKTSNDLTNKILIETVKTNNFKTNVDLNRLTIIIESIFFYKFSKRLSSNMITNTVFGPQDTLLYQELSHYVNAPIDDMTDVKVLNSTLLDITPEQEKELHELISEFLQMPSGTIRNLLKKSFSIKKENIPYSDEELIEAGIKLNKQYEDIKNQASYFDLNFQNRMASVL